MPSAKFWFYVLAAIIQFVNNLGCLTRLFVSKPAMMKSTDTKSASFVAHLFQYK